MARPIPISVMMLMEKTEHVSEHGDDAYQGEGAKDGHATDKGRHQGGRDAAEERQAQEDHYRQRDRLSLLDVAGDGVVHVAEDGPRSTDRRGQPLGVQMGLDLVVEGSFLTLLRCRSKQG